jgi:hypothetical protein
MAAVLVQATDQNLPEGDLRPTVNTKSDFNLNIMYLPYINTRLHSYAIPTSSP